MQLVNLRTGEIVAGRVEKAGSFLGRLVGLIGKKSMPERSALVLKPCKSVHTFFMRLSIDVVFLDQDGRVLLVIAEMPPFRISPVVKGALKAVELPGGTVKNGIRPGDVLVIVRSGR